MPDPEILPQPDRSPDASLASSAVETRSLRPKRLTCEFCECELDNEGHVLKRGDHARKILELEQALKDAQSDLRSRATEVTELIAELETWRHPVKRGFLDR